MMHPMIKGLGLRGILLFKLLLISLQEPAVILWDAMILFFMLVEHEFIVILSLQLLRDRVEVRLHIGADLFLSLLPLFVFLVVDIVDLIFVILFSLDQFV